VIFDFRVDMSMDILCALSGLVDPERPKKGIADIVPSRLRGGFLPCVLNFASSEKEKALNAA